ncbi:MAG: hypothetical protein QXT43_00900 [Candidatus Micrarchaeaceae archaeon]
MAVAEELFFEFVPIALGIVVLLILKSLRFTRQSVTIFVDAPEPQQSASGRPIGSHASRDFRSFAVDMLIANGLYVVQKAQAERLAFERLGLIRLASPVSANNALMRMRHSRICIYAEKESVIRCALSASSPLVLAYIIGYDIGVVNG